MAHVECPQCGGYVERSVDACPACGYFLPGHRILKSLLIVFVVSAALFLAIVMVSVTAGPLFNFFSGIAEHDARLEHKASKETEASGPKRAPAQPEAAGVERSP